MMQIYIFKQTVACKINRVDLAEIIHLLATANGRANSRSNDGQFR